MVLLGPCRIGYYVCSHCLDVVIDVDAGVGVIGVVGADDGLALMLTLTMSELSLLLTFTSH